MSAPKFLSQFLTARLNEREEDLQRMLNPGRSDDLLSVTISNRAGSIEWSVNSELRDISAKREIVKVLGDYEQALHEEGHEAAAQVAAQENVDGARWACTLLAQPYSWHEDFDTEWLI